MAGRREIDRMTDAELELLTPEERKALEGDPIDGSAPPDVSADSENERDGEDPEHKDHGFAQRQEKQTMPHDEKPGTEGDDTDKDADPAAKKDDADAEAQAAADAAAKKTADDAAAAEAATKAAADAEAAQQQTRRRARVVIPRVEVEGGDRDFGKERTALAQAYEAGDVSNAEFTEKLAEIVSAQTSVTMAKQFNEANARTAWEQQQANFFGDHGEYTASAMRMQALDYAVKHLANLKENAGKDGDEILDLAHDMVVKELGTVKAKEEPKPKAEETPAAEKGKDAKPSNVVDLKARKPKLDNLPTTLAHVPNASSDDTAEDQYTQLDRLDGLAFERAIARLTDDQRDAYLSRAG